MADRHREERDRVHLGAVLDGVFPHVQIAVIETRAQNPHEHLTGFDIGNRKLIDPDQFLRAVRASEAMDARGFHHALQGSLPENKFPAWV
jgi:hypothetical protein